MKLDIRGSARSWKCIGRLTVVGVGLASLGCDSFLGPTREVWGKISYKGEPVRGGAVVLSPTGDPLGPWGIGVILNNGDYYVISAEERKPMTPGRYEVSFRRPMTTPPERSAAGKDSNTQIPEKYLDVEHPFFSVELSRLPSEVDISLRD